LRRQEQEITDRAELEAILARATVCRLGLIDGDRPYIVPVCFAYCDSALYVHSAPEGHKIDVLRHYPQVCFEAEVDVELEPASEACSWGVRYTSVIGWGQATFLIDEEQKRTALSLLMAHYGENQPHTFSDQVVARVSVLKISIERMTGKRSHH
jgi:nitroimidazol reductase NimA-like FMN-containing flavoprotein (pyridoxamine 5'-phosphate oxidase superfamily)